MVEGTLRSPASLRDEIDTALRLMLTQEGCVRELQTPGAPEGSAEALCLRVLVDDYGEETRWDMGLTERAQPMGGHDPALDSRLVLDVTAQLELRVASERPPIRQKTFAVHVSGSPRFPGEDAAARLRTEMVEKVVRETRELLCKGSRRKLLRDIELARGAVPR